jgi:hypothetical protein
MSPQSQTKLGHDVRSQKARKNSDLNHWTYNSLETIFLHGMSREKDNDQHQKNYPLSSDILNWEDPLHTKMQDSVIKHDSIAVSLKRTCDTIDEREKLCTKNSPKVSLPDEGTGKKKTRHFTDVDRKIDHDIDVRLGKQITTAVSSMNFLRNVKRKTDDIDKLSTESSNIANSNEADDDHNKFNKDIIRYEKNQREKIRSTKIATQIQELHDILFRAGIRCPRSTKALILAETSAYI